MVKEKQIRLINIISLFSWPIFRIMCARATYFDTKQN